MLRYKLFINECRSLTNHEPLVPNNRSNLVIPSHLQKSFSFLQHSLSRFVCAFDTGSPRPVHGVLKSDGYTVMTVHAERHGHG